MNNVGRPKKEGLNKIVKVTVNAETDEMLDNVAQGTGKSQQSSGPQTH